MEQSEVRGDLTLEDLRVFLAVARCGSFRAAANQLFLSQPTLSRSLTRLEGSLQVQLFVRGPRGVVLTAAGETLVPRARAVVDSAVELQVDLLEGQQQRLVIGATATNARTILAPYLASWIPQNPNVKLKAIEDSDTMLLTRLENGDCDVAIVSSDAPLKVDSLKLGPVEVCAYIPRDHPLAQESGPISIAELKDEALLVNGVGFPSTIRVLAALEKGGFTPNIVYQCTTGQTLAAMAQARLGIALFGSTTILDGFDLATRPVVDVTGKSLGFDLFVVWKKSVRSALLTEFVAGLATATYPKLSAARAATVTMEGTSLSALE